MDHYHVWCDLRPGVRDLDLAEAAVRGLMEHFRAQGWIEGWGLSRRKLGFGPQGIGEFHVDIRVRDLAQLQEAFDNVTPRSGEVERLHAAVWSKVEGLRTALYRDFPDPGRQR